MVPHKWVRVLGLLGCLLLSACGNLALPLATSREQQAVDDTEPVLMRIATCWSAMPLVEDLTQLYGGEDTRVSFAIIPANSDAALQLLLDGQADLAIVGEEPAPEALRAMGGSSSRGFTAQTLALDPVAIVVPARNPIRQLTTAQVAQLFAGQHVDWSEVGLGSGRPEPVGRTEGAATRAVMQQLALQDLAFSSAVVLMPHDQGIADYVAEHEAAIGYLPVAYLDDRLGVVSVDGRLPTPDDVRSGAYPLVHPLVAIARSPASRQVAGLIALARSNRGRELIASAYILPR